MTEVIVNDYPLRRLTSKEAVGRQARWTASLRGQPLFFRTREQALTAVRKWPPPGPPVHQSVRARPLAQEIAFRPSGCAERSPRTYRFP